MKTYIFQESLIWEAGDPVDPLGRQVKIRAKTELQARTKLRRHKTSSLGRVWVLTTVK